MAKIGSESRTFAGQASRGVSDGTYLERTKGVSDPPANMPPYGRGPAGLRRELPGPLKQDTGTLVSEDWLPVGLFPELDELREEHHALLDELRGEGGKVSALHEKYAAEDVARQEALKAGEEPPPVTGAAERTDALNEAGARHWAVVERLAAFLEGAIGVIEEKWGKLPEFPDEPGATLPEWRQTFAAQRAEIEDEIEAAKQALGAAERKEGVIVSKERWLDRTSGQKANAGRYMAGSQLSPAPTRAEQEAYRRGHREEVPA